MSEPTLRQLESLVDQMMKANHAEIRRLRDDAAAVLRRYRLLKKWRDELRVGNVEVREDDGEVD